jgi:hypothetical protein
MWFRNDDEHVWIPCDFGIITGMCGSGKMTGIHGFPADDRHVWISYCSEKMTGMFSSQQPQKGHVRFSTNSEHCWWRERSVLSESWSEILLLRCLIVPIWPSTTCWVLQKIDWLYLSTQSMFQTNDDEVLRTQGFAPKWYRSWTI